MRKIVGLGALFALAWLPSCGGGSAQSEATTPPTAEGGSQGAGAEGGGDITVNIDQPEEGQMVVIDEQGRVGFQVNVRMELETLPGTSAVAAQMLGHAIQGRMTQIRGCYDRAVASDPEVEGSLELVVATDGRGRIRSDIARSGFTGGHITQCVVRNLRELPRGDVPQDARLKVILVASNTMAAGARNVREHEEQESQRPAPAN